MFINLSNHSSYNWSIKQLEATHSYGEIIDIPFPAVPATEGEEHITALGWNMRTILYHHMTL